MSPPLAVIAECLPYSGAGVEEAQAVVDALADRGFEIVGSPEVTG